MSCTTQNSRRESWLLSCANCPQNQSLHCGSYCQKRPTNACDWLFLIFNCYMILHSRLSREVQGLIEKSMYLCLKKYTSHMYLRIHDSLRILQLICPSNGTTGDAETKFGRGKSGNCRKSIFWTFHGLRWNCSHLPKSFTRFCSTDKALVNAV